MQIVIDIPEIVYDWFDNGFPDEDDAEKLWQIIKNGTPLPKGHGDLIDVKDLLEQIELEDTDENREENVGQIITLEDIDRITPIIEAESEESNGTL